MTTQKNNETERNVIVAKTETFVKEMLKDDSSGHDWWHIYRVVNCAKTIVHEEKADSFIVEMAALLHDVADHKFSDAHKRQLALEAFLDSINISNQDRTHIIEIIETLSFKGAHVTTEMRTIEGKVVQDADRLDAIGAIGIARCFAYGGSKNRELWDPDEKPILHTSAKSYHDNKSSSINHFYEKLLLLKDRMNTATAKRMAKHRHAVMQDFLDEFHQEWKGEK